MRLYRLSKYNPQNRSCDDKYNVETWTSISDIGKKFNGDILTLEQYLKIEEQYVTVIENIIRTENIEIRNIDIYASFSDINKMSRSYGVKNNKEIYKVLSKMKRRKYQIEKGDIKILIKIALRELADFTRYVSRLNAKKKSKSRFYSWRFFT